MEVKDLKVGDIVYLVRHYRSKQPTYKEVNIVKITKTYIYIENALKTTRIDITTMFDIYSGEKLLPTKEECEKYICRWNLLEKSKSLARNLNKYSNEQLEKIILILSQK